MYQTYLKKLADQEKEIDKLTDQQKKLMADEFKATQEVRRLPRQHHRLTSIDGERHCLGERRAKPDGCPSG